MEYHFNLLNEPWIPLIDLEGNRLELGILETLRRAHELREISDASPMVEYGLYRLLNVFLMDALRPEEIEDIEDLLDAGQFDMEAVNTYIDLCYADGASFDLFDKERPFLQVPYQEEYDKGKNKTVAVLDYSIPSGNNHIHFNHMQENTALHYSEAAKLLPACYLFATAGAQNYPSSINNTPPYFGVIRGENLYKTFVNMLLPVNNIQNFDEPNVFWRCPNVVEPKKKVVRTSWLYGMLFPARRVSLIPEDGMVRQVYISQGMNFCEANNWTDPHVTYRYSKDGRLPWRPNGTKPVWQNLNDIVDIEGHRAATILASFNEIHMFDEQCVHLTMYGVQTSKQSYLDLYRHDLQLPLALFRQKRTLLLSDCISGAEALAKELKYTLTRENPKTKEKVNKKAGITNSMITDTVQIIYQSCETELWTLCNTALSQETVDDTAVYRDWNKRLAEIGASAMRDLLSRLNLTGRQLVALSEPLSYWEGYLYNLKEKGEESHG